MEGSSRGKHTPFVDCDKSTTQKTNGNEEKRVGDKCVYGEDAHYDKIIPWWTVG